MSGVEASREASAEATEAASSVSIGMALLTMASLAELRRLEAVDLHARNAVMQLGYLLQIGQHQEHILARQHAALATDECPFKAEMADMQVWT